MTESSLDNSETNVLGSSMSLPPLVHSEECNRYRSGLTATKEEWLKDWPNHCKQCLGEGGDEDGCCSCCIENGFCPRCGRETVDPDTGEGPCKNCGWDYGRKPGNVMPDDTFYGCQCEYEYDIMIAALPPMPFDEAGLPYDPFASDKD